MQTSEPTTAACCFCVFRRGKPHQPQLEFVPLGICPLFSCADHSEGNYIACRTKNLTRPCWGVLLAVELLPLPNSINLEYNDALKLLRGKSTVGTNEPTTPSWSFSPSRLKAHKRRKADEWCLLSAHWAGYKNTGSACRSCVLAEHIHNALAGIRTSRKPSG